MNKYTYLIIGGGITADSAVQGIRELDTTGSIGILTIETHSPYDRPPLTKALWKGEDEKKIWRHTENYQVSIHYSVQATKIDRANRIVTDQLGTQYSYEKLLFATGGTPRHLSGGSDEILYYRNYNDYHTLKSLAESKTNFIVIGGGFIAWEITAALALNNKKVTMLFPSAGIGANLYPANLSQFLNSYYAEKGVTVLTHQSVTSVTKEGDTLVVQTQKGQKLTADVVIAGLGIEPNTSMAQEAGLTVNNGIAVDPNLRTEDESIYAAGDVANFYSPALKRNVRFEHEDNANATGKLAGRNMAGASETYDYLPFFYSDLFDLGYEAIGDVNSSLDIVEDWVEEFQQGVIYYLKEDLVKGVLLWNVWGQVEAARELVVSQQKIDPITLRGKIR
ncbi:FAD/NAD(P)-binding oxidoreductase [Cytophagaceae bacterium DM2B3-1]|uniref:FAD/NAD(P)-binding oxidoreductase n=1 Tax=Xanthocytophaga flava TaxID=3048013 RepID=A0ABT7CMC4_9BACT|nr:FAD/NAD(P)-binding oxidoreductase [Xanthocytophaga flavus]MDJ1467370.1 FAD/NAD(P)-binding oxidoreductase [Xanthocytophaga flavus]MDJ1494881.1 FAD/NAD(P)-binding oxidoreductase [Xanthocytophaga flavus]